MLIPQQIIIRIIILFTFIKPPFLHKAFKIDSPDFNFNKSMIN